MTAESAKTEPDERSIPLVMIAMVTPMPIRPITEICRTTFMRLRNWKKDGDKTESRKIIANKIKMMRYFLRKTFKFSLLKNFFSMISVVDGFIFLSYF